MLKKKYIGDKAFYKTVLGIAVPIMIQNAISNFVGLLDNLMIGRVGTNALSGVAIANQLIFIYYLLVFGAAAGIGIFTAQYHGVRDNDGIRYTFRTKLIVNSIITALSIAILMVFSVPLISLYLRGEGSAADVADTLRIGQSYMRIMLIGLIPMAWTQAYAGTLRETGARPRSASLNSFISAKRSSARSARPFKRAASCLAEIFTLRCDGVTNRSGSATRSTASSGGSPQMQ